VKKAIQQELKSQQRLCAMHDITVSQQEQIEQLQFQIANEALRPNDKLKLDLIEFYISNDASKIPDVDSLLEVRQNLPTRFTCTVVRTIIECILQNYEINDLCESLQRKYGMLPNNWPPKHGTFSSQLPFQVGNQFAKASSSLY
jgi:hypothetical protein